MWSYKSIDWKKRLKDCERLITAPFMSWMLTNGTNHGRLITVIDADVTSHRWSARIFFLPRLLKGPCTMIDLQKKRRRRKKKGGRVEWSRTYSFGKRSGGRNELARSLLTNTLFTNSKSTWVLALVCSSMTKIITQNPVPMPRVMKFRTDYLKFFSSDISLFGIDSGTIEKISNLIYLVFMMPSISLQQVIILIRPVSSIFKNVNFKEPLFWNLHFLGCVTRINAKLWYVLCLVVYEIKVLEISRPLHLYWKIFMVVLYVSHKCILIRVFSKSNR